MSGPRDLMELVRSWVEKAEHDLRNAEHTLTLESDCPFDTVCFHAQQCAEKHLKAALVYRGSEVPRTHDLTELLVLVRHGGDVDVEARDTQLLMPYAVQARYPGIWDATARAEAEEAVEAAKQVRAAVRSVLPEGALGSR